MPVNCGSCSVLISRSTESSIVCKSCKKCFHPKCVNLDEKNLSSSSNNWCCASCKLSNVHAALKSMESDLNSFKANTDLSISNITGSLKALTDLSGIVTENTKRIDNLQIENREIKRDLSSLRNYCNRLESITRMNNVVISGIPEKSNENVQDIVVKVADSLGLKISRDQISKVTRFRPRNGTIKPILVSFVSPTHRNNILISYTTRKVLKGGAIGLSDDVTIRIGEHLSTLKQSLLQKSKKELKSTGLYAFVWSQNGNILIRKTSTSKILKINSLDDIEKFKSLK